jgi:ATP-dependent protease ClpP protease subunit
MTDVPKEIDDSDDIALAADIAQSIALAEKFQYEAERAKWEAKREELSYLQEKAEFDFQRDGVYSFYRGVNPKSASRLLHAMERWHHHDPDGPWTILLNSPGGHEDVTYAIVDQLRNYSRRTGGTHRIEIRVTGIAASGGAMILQAADHRVLGRFSRVMMHKPGAHYNQKLTTDELVDEAEYCRRGTDLIIDLFLERTDKITRPEILRKISRKDWWIDSPTALKLGFCDAIR